MFEDLRKGLQDAYRFRKIFDCKCILCGASGKTFALHLVEFLHPSSEARVDGLVYMSESNGWYRGGVPFCSDCVHCCKKCGLPYAPKGFEAVLGLLQDVYEEIGFSAGVGRCGHFHIASMLEKPKTYSSLSVLRVFGRVVAKNKTPKLSLKERKSDLDRDHEMAIEIVAKQLQNEGHEILNLNFGTNDPLQVRSLYNGNVRYFIVRAARFEEPDFTLDDVRKLKELTFEPGACVFLLLCRFGQQELGTKPEIKAFMCAIPVIIPLGGTHEAHTLRLCNLCPQRRQHQAERTRNARHARARL